LSLPPRRLSRALAISALSILYCGRYRNTPGKCAWIDNTIRTEVSVIQAEAKHLNAERKNDGLALFVPGACKGRGRLVRHTIWLDEICTITAADIWTRNIRAMSGCVI